MKDYKQRNAFNLLARLDFSLGPETAETKTYDAYVILV